MKKILFAFVIAAMLSLSMGPKSVYALDPIEIVSVNYPSVVAPGEKFCFSVTVKVNSGQLSESKGDMLRNTNGNLFGHWPHVAVSGTTNIGGTYTFNCYGDGFTAPSTEGTYESKWQVWQDGRYVGPEVLIRFEVRNGGGSGGAGGGGGWSVQCPNGVGAETVLDKAHKSSLIDFTHIIEYAAAINILYCDSVVNVDTDGDGFSLNNPLGTISTDSKLNITSVEYGSSIKNTETAFKVGIARDNTDYPYLPYYGYVFTQSLDDSNRMFSIENEIEQRHFRGLYVQPNYAYNPQYIKAYILESLANARVSLAPSQYSMYVTVMVSFAMSMGLLLLLSAPPQTIALHTPDAVMPIHSYRSLRTLKNIRSYADPQANILFEQRYGNMRDWAETFDVNPSRTTVSAYTEFTISGSGFTPNGIVFYQFGLPGQEPLVSEGIVADSEGNVEFLINMPEPSLVPLGTYLFAAFDDRTVDSSMQQALSGNTDPTKFKVGITAIEVVEDVTPPTITIASPIITAYDRCDQPMVDYVVTDDLSGVASYTSWLDNVLIQNRTILDMLFWNLGNHQLDVQAFDKVGWEQNQLTEFQLIATIDGTRCALDRFREAGQLKNLGAYVALNALLDTADRSLMFGKENAAISKLTAALKVLIAQKKQIDPIAYNILFGDITELTKNPIR